MLDINKIDKKILDWTYSRITLIMNELQRGIFFQVVIFFTE